MSRVGALSPVMVAVLAVSACTTPPPTITPGPTAGSGATVQELQLPPPSGTGASAAVPAAPVVISATAPYRDASGAFSMEVPVGWPESRQPIDPAKGDAKLGTLFMAPEGNGILTVTHFDKGRRPDSLGVAINQVLELTGVLALPNFAELGREKVYEREGDAMRVELAYSTSAGIAMHCLVLFQIDGTVLSMVNMGVEAGSWNENQGLIRDVLASYRVPAAS